MKPPAGRQIQIWFRNEDRDLVVERAEGMDRTVAHVIRKAALFTLNNPHIVWTDGSPDLNSQDQMSGLRALVESKDARIRELEAKIKELKAKLRQDE